MTYISAGYYALLAFALLFYYLFPLNKRWIILLISSFAFYFLVDQKGIPAFVFSIASSYLAGRIIQKKGGKGRLSFSITLSCLPLWMHLYLREGQHSFLSAFMPLGVSFFSLQIISYLADVYQGKIQAEENLLHYALFLSFFPQIIQGPIPRYSQLCRQLIEGHRFDEKGFTKGIQLIIWGFFLKLMIADKAAIAVNSAFQSLQGYAGIYSFLVLLLYFFQLYADFLACTTLSQGAAQLFGIQLVNNFERPLLSTSVQDFWRRWHMSLGTWLRNYVYIPLGGSRRGKVRKYLNILAVFLVSGIWHGNGIQFLFWGMLQAFYQIIGSLTRKDRDHAWSVLHIDPEGKFRRCMQVICTFLLITISWSPFRANGLKEGFFIYLSLFRKSSFPPSDAGLFMNLEWKEWIVLIVSLIILFTADILQEKGMHIRKEILKRKPAVNWALSIACVWIIFVFGTYGYGYNAQSFIYGGF